MRSLVSALLLGPCALVSVCHGLKAQGLPPQVIVTSGNSAVVQADQTINTSGTVTISSGTSVTFQTGNTINLQNGFQATAGSSFHAFVATPDFVINVTPTSSSTVLAGGGVTYSVTVSSIFNFTGTVYFSAAGVTGLPQGATASFSAGSISPPVNGTSGAITLTITTAAGITGNYAFTVLGTSLGYPSHQGTSSLSVQDFSLSISPSLLTIPSRGSGTFTITVTPINGFSGTIPLARTWVNSTPYIAEAWSLSDSITGGGQVQYTVTDEGSSLNATFALQIGGDNRYADAYLHIGSSVPSPSVSCSGSPTQPAIGQTVTFTAAPSGGTPPYTYSWSGAVSGSGQSASFTPMTLSALTASVTVTDSNYLSATASCSVNSGPGGNTLTITTSSTLSYGTAGSAYSQTLAASGGTGSYTWSALSTLPAGLTLSSSGVLSGNPSTAGSYISTFRWPIPAAIQPPMMFCLLQTFRAARGRPTGGRTEPRTVNGCDFAFAPFPFS